MWFENVFCCWIIPRTVCIQTLFETLLHLESFVAEFVQYYVFFRKMLVLTSFNPQKLFLSGALPCLNDPLNSFHLPFHPQSAILGWLESQCFLIISFFWENGCPSNIRTIKCPECQKDISQKISFSLSYAWLNRKVVFWKLTLVEDFLKTTSFFRKNGQKMLQKRNILPSVKLSKRVVSYNLRSSSVSSKVFHF